MRFLVDECTGPSLAKWLRGQRHEVFSVYEEARGMSDDEVIFKAHSENRILTTNDKDFGEKVYREQRTHCGVILLRLEDERASVKIATFKKLLDGYAEHLMGNFVVCSERRVRFSHSNRA